LVCGKQFKLAGNGWHLRKRRNLVAGPEPGT
jgi:hypothetical protein